MTRRPALLAALAAFAGLGALALDHGERRASTFRFVGEPTLGTVRSGWSPTDAASPDHRLVLFGTLDRYTTAPPGAIPLSDRVLPAEVGAEIADVTAMLR